MPTSNTTKRSTAVARIQFHVGHEPGQLRASLAILEAEGLNMTHIESQPTATLGLYRIFVDVDLSTQEMQRKAEIAVEKVCVCVCEGWGVDIVGM